MFAVVIIVACLVVFPSCDNGSTGVSLTTADLEGIRIATGEDEGTAIAMLFEFSGNDFTCVFYTDTPDSDDMIQDEGSKGTYSVSDDTLMIEIDGPVYFEKKPFSLPSALVDTWYELSADTLLLRGRLHKKIPFERPILHFETTTAADGDTVCCKSLFMM